MHRRAREHVGLVVKRKLMRRRRRIISGKDWWNILHGWKEIILPELKESE